MTLWYEKRNNKIERHNDEVCFMPLNRGMLCVSFELEIEYSIRVECELTVDYRGLRHETHCQGFWDRDWDTEFFHR